MGGKCPPTRGKFSFFFLNLPLFLQIFAFSMGFAPFCENCALFPRLPPGLVKSLPPLNVTFKYVRSPFFYILFGQNQRSLIRASLVKSQNKTYFVFEEPP